MNECKAWEELRDRVIEENLCTYCGACTGMCPYLVPYKGRIIIRDQCSLDNGRCRAFCPRVGVDLTHVHNSMFGSSYESGDIGVVKDVFISRAADPKILSAGQYGGVVTALGVTALEEGMVDSVVATDSQDKCAPFGAITSRRADLFGCAGSSYVAAATVDAFNRAVREEHRHNLAVVCTPCQSLALANMTSSDLAEKNNMGKLKLVIGLFCTWALSYESFGLFLMEKVDPHDVVKVDIPPPPAETFDVYTRTAGRLSLPLSDVRPFIREACTYCIDMTAEFTDVSVGAAEGIDGWNTVIVRSERGLELIDKAVKRGHIKIETLPEKNLNHLKDASRMKKKRALKNICRKTGSRNDLLYLRNCPTAMQILLEEE